MENENTTAVETSPENTTAVETQQVTDAPAEQPNDAQSKAAEILAARKGKGKTSAPKTSAPKTSAPKTEGEPAEAKAPKEVKPKAAPTKLGYRFLRDLDSNDKLNAQQKVLMDAMLKVRKAEGPMKDVVLREELLNEITVEALKTRQPVERVFGFYLNSWKKNHEATDKKVAILPLLEVVKIAIVD